MSKGIKQNSTIFDHLVSDRSWLAVCLAAFSLPYYHNWSILAIAFLFFILLTDKDVLKRLSNFRHNKLLFPMILLYIIYVIGMLYTKNAEEGWTVLEAESPLLLFPILLSALDYSKPEKNEFVMISFIAGCLLAGFVCLGVAIYTWITTRVDHFFYSEFSLFMHPSYFALYLNLALCYIYQKVIFENGIKYITVPVAIFLLFFINGLVLMLSSKAGIFTASIMQLTMLIVSLIKRRNSRWSVSIFTGLVLCWFLFYKVFLPDGQERIAYSERMVMNKPIENTASESSSVRLLIWKSSLPLAKKTFPFGVGTGDVKDELVTVYKENGITSALEKELNAHNQFLQTLLAVGLPGLILLILSIVLPFIRGLRKNNFLLYMFCFICFFNFLFESMLERQIGVVFFTFFSTLLIKGCSLNKMETQ